jgi:hypothetical protein
MYIRPLPSMVILALLSPGCRSRPVQTARVASYADAPGLADSSRGTQSLGAAHGKVEFEAPPLIPAMRAQVDQIARPEGSNDSTALRDYRSAASRLVDAMKADLARVGLADTGAFRLLGDSVLHDVGGGIGLVDPPAPERVAIDRMRRLIVLYESWMRQVPN